MANIDGLPVNSAVTHAEFMSRTEDTSTTGSVNFQNVTESTSTTTGAIRTAGGLGVEKSLNVGLDTEIGGTLTVQTNLDVNGVATVVGILNTNDIAASGNINTTLDMSANNILAVGDIEAQTEMITPLITATTADVGTLNLTNAFTAPSLTVTADATIHGNLTVNGTTVTLNTATVDSEDPNITVNKTGNDASSEGAGFTVDRTGTKGSFVYANALASKFKIGDLASEAEVVTVSHTQTLTNKTLTSPVLTTPTTDIISATEQGSTPATPASGVRKLYPKADGFYQLDSTGLETKVGSGSGGGGAVNLITNGSADDAITSIFAPYADAAGTRPVDGTGGSPTVTTSISAVSPLTGTKSYLLTKPASNTQGEGWAVATVPLDLSYRAKALKISVDYVVNSGTFVAGSRTTDSDIIWTCYDITNSKIVEPSNIKMFASSTTISDKFEATVQFDYNCTSFRLIAHCATTSTAAYEIKVDNVTVSPSVYVYGSPVTDFGLPIVHTSNVTTNATLTTKTRRVGDSYHVIGNIAFSGANTQNVTPSITLPYGLDSSKLPSTGRIAVGQFTIRNGGTGAVTSGSLIVSVASFGNVVAFEGVNPSLNSPYTIGANHEYGFEFTIPVVGLGSSVQMSDSADARLMLARYKTAAAQSIPSATFTIVDFGTKDFDTHGAVTTGAAWKFTAISSGYFRIGTHIRVSTSLNAVNFAARIYKNGVAGPALADNTTDNSASGRGDITGSTIVELVAGDYVDIRVIQNSGGAVTLLSDADYVYIDIEKLSGPSAIAANESINAVYTTAAGQSIPNATDTIIDFGTAEINSHGNVVTGGAWKFTANTSGVYEVSAFTQLAGGGSWSISEEALITLFKNGTSFSRIGINVATVAHTSSVPVQCAPRQIRLLAEDYIDLRMNQNSGAALSLVAAAQINWVSIKKVGN